MKNKSVLEKYKGLTVAQAAEKISKKYPNRDFDLTQKNSYELELNTLNQHQERLKLVEQAKEVITQFKKGGVLPKYGGGTNDLTEPAVPKAVNPFAGMLGRVPNIAPLSTPMAPISSMQVTTGPLDSVRSSDYTKGPLDSTATPITTGRELSAYTPALIGQGLSTALNIGLLAGGYDKVAPSTNPYESEVKNLMASRSIDTTQQRNQILSAYNAAREGLSGARSANVRNALDANLMNVTQDSLAQSKLQEQQINLGLKGDYANTLNSLGQQKAAAQFAADELTAQNKGQFESNVSAVGAGLADSAKFFTTQKLNTIQNKLYADIVSTKYQNFGLNKEVVDRLSQGKLTPDDIIIIKKAYGEAAGEELIKRFELNK